MDFGDRISLNASEEDGAGVLLAFSKGGNQRELARQKNLKKTQETHKGKRKEDSLSASQRKQRDSEIMQQKQKAANERKSLQAGAK
ncbi:small EDRK-rich factor 1 isoform X2 [Aptenodytes patagonicus]|uniref:small EDRK-rich factor 1 isoform X2 n=1 Tax=Aptenodytes patagonicus TaxID=9234 RepID=UPI003F9FC102